MITTLDGYKAGASKIGDWLDQTTSGTKFRVINSKLWKMA